MIAIDLSFFFFSFIGPFMSLYKEETTDIALKFLKACMRFGIKA